jgi:hypothetical protein
MKRWCRTGNWHKSCTTNNRLFALRRVSTSYKVIFRNTSENSNKFKVTDTKFLLDKGFLSNYSLKMSLQRAETWIVDARLLFLQSVSTLLALYDLSFIKIKFCCSVQVQTLTSTLSGGPLSFLQHKQTNKRNNLHRTTDAVQPWFHRQAFIKPFCCIHTYTKSLFTFATSCRLALTQPAHPRTNNRGAVATVFVLRLRTGPLQSLPKRVPQTMRSSASSFKFQYLSFSSSSSGLQLLPRLPVPLCFLPQRVSAGSSYTPVSLPSFYCTQYIALLPSCLCQLQVLTFQVP